MKVRIYKPAKSAAQSGRSRTHDWVVEPDLVSPRVPEQLMGWSSAMDTMSEMKGRLRFKSLDDAVAFARRENYEFTIEEALERRVVPRSYLSNFQIVRPEDEERKFQSKS